MSEAYSIVRKRRTLMLLHDSEVRCPRKGPVGNVISVVKCADIFEGTPEGCNGCQIHLDARLKAVPLRKMSTENLRYYPRQFRPLPI